MNAPPPVAKTRVVARADWAMLERMLGESDRPSASPRPRTQVIVEGLAPSALADEVEISSIAGCACCTGQLALHVTLMRVLRRTPPPQRLWIVVADPAHVPRLCEALSAPPWAARLVLI